jgi:hypothetical protein
LSKLLWLDLVISAHRHLLHSGEMTIGMPYSLLNSGKRPRSALTGSCDTAAKLVAQGFASFRSKANLKLFDRRGECIEWNPARPHTVTISSHGGDVVLIKNIHTRKFDAAKCARDVNRIRTGRGAGGCILSMRYDPLDNSVLYAVGHDSKLTAIDVETSAERAMMNTQGVHNAQ